MKVYRSFPVMILALGLSTFSVRAFAQNYPAGEPYPAPYTDLRGLVDRAQTDLRAAADLEHEKKKQRERFESAQGHLSTFDRNLVKGKFDHSEIDKAIGEFKGILDHNVLQAGTRDALMRDMEDLKAARDRRY